MLSRQIFVRTFPRVSQQCRSTALRQTLQRRFASSNEPPLTGAADNAFNRERRAVKAHAAASSGKLLNHLCKKSSLWAIGLYMLDYRILAEVNDIVKLEPLWSYEILNSQEAVCASQV